MVDLSSTVENQPSLTVAQCKWDISTVQKKHSGIGASEWSLSRMARGYNQSRRKKGARGKKTARNLARWYPPSFYCRCYPLISTRRSYSPHTMQNKMKESKKKWLVVWKRITQKFIFSPLQSSRELMYLILLAGSWYDYMGYGYMWFYGVKTQDCN